MRKFSSRLERIIEETSSGNASNFSKSTDIPYSTLHGYLKGRPPHSEHLIRIRNKWRVSIDWLLSGEGNKFIQDGVSESQPLDPNPEIAELMEGARGVLTSGIPEAFDALERNIRYFTRAIAAEKRADKIEREMKEGFDYLKDEIARMKREKSYINTGKGELSSEKKVA